MTIEKKKSVGILFIQERKVKIVFYMEFVSQWTIETLTEILYLEIETVYS